MQQLDRQKTGHRLNAFHADQEPGHATQGQAGGAAGQGSGNLFASLGTGFSPSLGIRPRGAAAAAAAPLGGPSLLESQGPAASVTPRSVPPTEFPMHAEVVAVRTFVGQVERQGR
jgi:hypothetical protein